MNEIDQDLTFNEEFIKCDLSEIHESIKYQNDND